MIRLPLLPSTRCFRLPNSFATAVVYLSATNVDATTGADVQTGTFNADGTADTSTDLASGTINFQNGAITGVKFDTIPANGNPIRLYYTYDGEANAIRPRMKLDVKKMIVEAKPRRLTTIFSVEALQDLRSQQGMNLESQISGAATREIISQQDASPFHSAHLYHRKGICQPSKPTTGRGGDH